MISSLPRPLAIIGPTGSGKTALSLFLAEEFGGEIINTDSMQLYKGMDIGTAKISPRERRGIIHHQLDTLDITDTASVASFQQAAIADIEQVRHRGRIPIIVGGSMLYFQSLIDDWSFPPTDPQVRKKWEERLEEKGLDSLRQYLADIDPSAASIIEARDPRRTVRALEVIELTGKPFAASQPPKNAPPRWNTILIGLEAQPEWLNPRLEERVTMMFNSGFIDEVRILQEQGLRADSTAGRAIGYGQVLAHLSGDMSLEEAKESTLIATRQYARRQRSWFRRDPRVQWFDASSQQVKDDIKKFLSTVD